MSLTTYCDFAEVRAALGVNDLELKDAVLSLPVYEMGLVRELSKLSMSLNASFSTIHDKLPGSRTAAEAALHDAVRLFSVYAVAKQVGVSLATFAPKDVGDGKATVSRFSGTPFEDTLARIEKLYAALKGDVISAYAGYSGVVSAGLASTVPPTAFMASGRSYDPVTG